jgi:hypothetical protein
MSARSSLPLARRRAVFHLDVVGEVVERRRVVSAAGRVEYGLSAVKVEMVGHLAFLLTDVPGM